LRPWPEFSSFPPARETLAELLFRQNHPREFLAEYEAVLKIAPNRFNALYGAANAAEAAGNTQAANEYFHKLTQIAVGDERPELATARKDVEATVSQLSTEIARRVLEPPRPGAPVGGAR